MNWSKGHYPFRLPLSKEASQPRQAKLRKKKVGRSVYWFTKAGGDTYFGNVDAVPYKEARKLFSNHIQTLVGEDGASKGKHGLAAGELMDLFLDWIKPGQEMAERLAVRTSTGKTATTGTASPPPDRRRGGPRSSACR